MPETPWIMTQSWHDLLFAHWQVDPARLATLIPPPLQLDLFRGEAWIGVVPFRMEHVSPRGLPALPWLSAFPELNVRTYVRVGDRPGVFFFSLDATNPIVVRVARRVFHLPYYRASIDVRAGSDHVARYHSRRTDARSPVSSAEFLGAYRPMGPVFRAVEGTREYFLTERYCLYSIDRRTRAHACQIHHAPWPLQRASSEIELNTLLNGPGLGLFAETRPALLHFAKRQDTVAWRPTLVSSPRDSRDAAAR